MYLNGRQLASNSIVMLEDIGAGECPLTCYTNFPDCCKSSNLTTGEWYFPNRIAVSIEVYKNDLYRDRGTRVVRLNRRYNARAPTGIYCCDIPGSSGNLCVGAYNLGDSKQIEF